MTMPAIDLPLPDLVSDWLRRNQIPFFPAEPEQAIFAEWDRTAVRLYLGWWEEDRCPTCGQTDQPRSALIAPKGFDSSNWQHGCGQWWEPFTVTVDLGSEFDENGEAADDDRVLQMLDEALGKVKERQRSGVAALEKRLTNELRRFLAEYLTDEDREANATGSEIQPGIWRPDGGQWEAWDYHPANEGETVTVIEDELKTSTRSAGSTGEVALTIRLDRELAEQLWHTGSKSFALNKLDRFEIISKDVDLTDARWSNGSQMWCESAADAIMLIAYEKACGYQAAMAWDLEAADEQSRRVVLSTRPIERD